ncbi:MAG TPA: class I SAM-dependent methyltransferase [Nitrososphaeraceae archaeon]|nr:class I SAM-dependent methyltransferase [Nitrososphaeraceae archaeon]
MKENNQSPLPSSFNSEQFKTEQRQRWDSVAEGWKEWWQTVEFAAQKVSDRLVELAQIKPGQKVLDIATGIGEPAVTAAKRLFPDYANKTGDNSNDNRNRGHVLATDISSEMLTIAKQRATELGLQDIIEFKEADAEMLELSYSMFDAVLCRWGLMFMPNLNNTLSMILRALLPGGRLACAVWAEASKVPFISFPMNIVMHELNVPPIPLGAPGAFALADIGILQNSLSQVGFTNIQYERLNVTFEFPRVEDYINYTKDIGSMIKIMLSKESAERQEEIWDIVTEQIRNNYTTVNNDDDNNKHPVRIDNECICISAKKPLQL